MLINPGCWIGTEQHHSWRGNQSATIWSATVNYLWVKMTFMDIKLLLCRLNAASSCWLRYWAWAEEWWLCQGGRWRGGGGGRGCPGQTKFVLGRAGRRRQTRSTAISPWVKGIFVRSVEIKPVPGGWIQSQGSVRAIPALSSSECWIEPLNKPSIKTTWTAASISNSQPAQENREK